MKLRLIILGMTLLAITAFTAGAYVYYKAMRSVVQADADMRMASTAGAIAFRLSSALSENVNSVRALAGMSDLAKALVEPNAERVRSANQMLARFQQVLNASESYLMDSSGLTIAASNAGRPDTFVGHNYAFRPYFQNAMQGLPWVQLAVDVTSGKPGIYTSHPVVDEGPNRATLGVVAAKSAIEPLEKEIYQYFNVDWILVDQEGRVMAGSRPEWYQRLVPSRIRTLAVAKKRPPDLQAGSSWIGMRPTGEGRVEGPNGREYLVHSALVPGFGEWQILTFDDGDESLTLLESPIVEERQSVLLLLSLAFITLISTLYAIAREDMRRRQAAHDSLKRNNAYMEALHETTLGLLRRMTPNELIESVLSRAGALTGTRNGFLSLYDKGGHVLKLKVGIGAFSQAVGLQVKPGEGLVGRIFSSGQPLLIPDYSKWSGRLEDPEIASLRAVMGIPLKTGDQIVGVMGLGHLTPDKPFGPEEQGALKRLAELATIVLDNSLLYHRLQRELKERKRAQDALARVNAKLQRQAVIDGLTQIANRRYFDERLEAEWRRLRREKQSLSLLICDVDFFKQFNDSKGHLAGDDCLKMVARAIAANVRRPGDLAARFGGEEFAVILSGTDAAGALQVAEQIRSAVEALAIEHPNSQTAPHLTVSLGGATAFPRAHEAPQTIIEAADQALYAAKDNGRNRVVVHQVKGSA